MKHSSIKIDRSLLAEKINMEKLSSVENNLRQSYLHTPKRILFACVPADGHFNPLTRLTIKLKNEGYDVRWYISPLYADKLKKMDIHHYTYKKALNVNGQNLEDVFPERAKIKGLVKKL